MVLLVAWAVFVTTSHVSSATTFLAATNTSITLTIMWSDVGNCQLLAFLHRPLHCPFPGFVVPTLIRWTIFRPSVFPFQNVSFSISQVLYNVFRLCAQMYVH